MKQCKRWISMLLALVMVVSMVPLGISAYAEAPETSDPIPQGPVNIQKAGISYYPSFGNKDFETTFYYDDNYFTNSAYDYQDSLSTMSLCLALSAFGSTRADNNEEGYKHKSMNLEALLSECGYPAENYATNHCFREKPTTDSIGVGASSKQILDDGEPCTLIAAAIRGGGYESEWASNFTLGTEGHHQGFDEARDQVLAFLSEYIDSHEITGRVKLWITGYSRAAATTNLVAGALDNGYTLSDSVTLDGEDLFAYCFECPQGATNDDDVTADRFGNIFNIVNPGDLVTKIAPSKPDRFGFQRYGVNCYLPTALKEGERYNDLLDAMLVQYNQIPSAGEYIVDDFQMKKISISKLFWDLSGALKDGIIVDNNDEKWDQNAFLDEVVFKLFNENFKSRANYVRLYQKDMRELCKVLFGSGDKFDLFPDVFMENLNDKAAEIAACLILHLDRRLQSIVEHAATDALSELGITDYTPKQIKLFVAKVVGLILPFGINNPNLTVTAISNIKGIGYAHVPEVCMAWLQSFDPNYTQNAVSAFNSGIHRVIRVDQSVDVLVRDENDAVVASLVGSEAQKVDGSTIVSFVNDQGEKLVYLPAGSGYQVELQATEAGTLNYSVQEYSEEAGGVDRIVNYYDIPVEAGSRFCGIVPSMIPSEQAAVTFSGSRLSYALTDEAGNELTADEVLAGSDALEANFEVQLTTNDEALGAVTGGGVFKTGTNAQLTAIPNENCTFTGWYAGEELVSEDPEYRFSVTEDVTLEGRFVSDNPTDPETDSAFTDVAPDAYYADAVRWAVENGITNGVTDTTFAPEKTCTRGEIVTFLWRAAGSPAPQSTENPFTDLTKDFYQDAVLWAVENGITEGTTATTFSPDAPCTRAQAVTFLWRAAGSPDPQSTENPFTDVPEDFYTDAVLWAVENGISNGKTDTTFAPDLSCTRAEIVTFLYRSEG